MREAQEQRRHQPTVLANTLLSLAGHCLAVAALMQLAGRPSAVIPPAIMVDIRNVPGAASPPAEPAPRPTRKGEDRPTGEQARVPLRERLPDTEPARPADWPVVSPAAPSGSLPIREKPLLPAKHPEPPTGQGLPLSAAPPGERSDPVVVAHPEREAAAAAYLARVRGLIDRHKEYPVTARRGRIQGTVRVRCALARSGEVLTAAIHRSSGFGILDNAALRAVREAGPFPALPDEVTGETLVFELPVVFRLAQAGL